MKSPLLYIGLLLVFAMTAALIGPLFVDWSNYRSDIEAYGERMTGRQVKVNGDISVRLLPAPILRVGDVRVSNPVEAASPELLVARMIEAKLSLAPLLRGKIEITSVEIDQPVIEAEALPRGGTWRLSPMGGFERLLVADDVQLEDARITGGTLVVRDTSRDFVAQLDNLDMSLQAPSLAGPFKVRGSFDHDGVARRFGLSTGKRRADRPTHVGLTLAPVTGRGKQYALDGMLDEKDDAPSFKGRLRVVEADATETGKQDRVAVDLTQMVPFELRSDIEANLDEAVLDNVQFILGSGRNRATMTGEARVDIWNGPRLDAKLSARRLDLDSVVSVQGQDGEAPRPAPSTREILGQIPRLLEFLPKTLTGQLAMDVDGLVLGGHQIEGAGVTLGFEPGRFAVSRAVGRLPGQSQLSITGAYHPDAEDTDFDGVFSLKSRDAKTFITWLAPKLLPVLDPKAGGARGNLDLKGELRIRKTLVELVGAEATIDKSTARLGLSVAFTERLAFGLRLILDDFNLDRYLPPRRSVAEASDDPAGAEAEPEPASGVSPTAILGEFDANVEVQAKRMMVYGTAMRDLAVDLTLRGGKLTVRDLSVADLGGAQLQAKGELTDVVARPEGRLEGSLEAQDPSGLLALLGAGPAEDEGGLTWGEWAAGWGPASLTASLDATGSGETPKLALAVTGYLGNTRTSIEGDLAGALTDLPTAKGRLKVDLLNQQGDELLRQLGIAAAEPPKGEERPGVARGEVAGTLAGGLDLSLGLEAFGAEMTATGKATRIAGVASLEAEVKLAAKDAGPLYRAMNLAGGDGGSLSLRALVAGKEGEYVITGLTGTVAEVPVNINGTANLNGAVPELRLAANVAELSLPWALSVLVGGDGTDNPITQAVAAVGTGGAVVPVWSPQPFRPGNLSKVMVDLKAEVGTLGVGADLAMRGASFAAKLGEGRLALTGLKGRLFGGTLDLSATVTAARDQVSLQSTYALDGADLAEIARFAASEPPVGGRIALKGEIKGAGRNMISLMSSLGGEGQATITGGELRRFNAPAFAEALREARDEEQVENVAETVLADGALEIGDLGAGYSMASGLVRVDALKVATESVTGRVSTVVDLAAWRFDNEWQLAFDKISDAPAMTVSIAGPLGDGERSLDIRELKTFLTMKALNEDMIRLEEMERRAREQIRLEEEALQKAEDEARRRREEEDRKRGVTTITPQSPLDQPVVPPRSGSNGGQSSLPKQADRIGPAAPAATRPAASAPATTEDGVIRLAPNQRLPLPDDARGSAVPERVEQQPLAPPGQ